MTNERMKLLNCTLGLVAGVSLPVSALAVPQPAQEQTEKQPNIILIVADDLGYGDLSCYGAHRIQTPGMDRIANEGIRFTQGFCTAATSTPSRYSVMTGKYPWSNVDAKILPGNAALIIDTQKITLPKLMKQAGYTTGSVGKWHIGLGDGHVDWNKEVHPGAAEITTIRLFRQQPMIVFLASFWKMEELSDWIRMTLFMWITGKTSPANLPVKRTPNCCACIPVWDMQALL